MEAIVFQIFSWCSNFDVDISREQPTQSCPCMKLASAHFSIMFIAFVEAWLKIERSAKVNVGCPICILQSFTFISFDKFSSGFVYNEGSFYLSKLIWRVNTFKIGSLVLKKENLHGKAISGWERVKLQIVIVDFWEHKVLYQLAFSPLLGRFNIIQQTFSGSIS